MSKFVISIFHILPYTPATPFLQLFLALMCTFYFIFKFYNDAVFIGPTWLMHDIAVLDYIFGLFLEFMDVEIVLFRKSKFQNKHFRFGK